MEDKIRYSPDITKKYILSKDWWIREFIEKKAQYLTKADKSISLDDIKQNCITNCISNMEKFDPYRSNTSREVWIYWRCRQELWKFTSKIKREKKREQKYRENKKAEQEKESRTEQIEYNSEDIVEKLAGLMERKLKKIKGEK